MFHLFICFIILFVALTGWRLKSLSGTGAIAAVVVGFCIYLGFSYKGLILLGCFFVSSSMLSKIKHAKKREVMEILEKDDQRDSVQVFANGGVPALIALLHTFNIGSGQILLVGFCVALAAANADTWASEVGTLSKQEPRLLMTFKRVQRGTSGAVSLLGTAAAFAGAMMISFIGSVLFSLTWNYLIAIILFGFLGNTIDTLLGQFIQIKYKCVSCGKITEKRTHCLLEGKKRHAYQFLNNDAVNGLSIALAAFLGILFFS